MAPKRKSSAVTTVVKAVTGTESLPSDLRSLLGSVLPTVLNTYKSDRHAFEAEIVEQAKEALIIAQKSCASAHADALKKETEVISVNERAKRDAAKTEALEKMNQAQTQVAACDASNKDAGKGVSDAETAVKLAQKEENAAEKTASKTKAKETTLVTATTTTWTLIIEGTFVKKSAKDAAVKSVVALGKENGVGSTLSQAFVLACNTEVSARSEFETTTLSTVKGKLEVGLQSVTKQLADEQAIVEQKKADTAAAKEKLVAAQAVATEASGKLDAAKEALKLAKKTHAQAVTFRHKVWEDMRTACDAQDELAAALKNITDVILPTFEELKEKEAPPPPPEPEVVEEPPEKKQRVEEGTVDAPVAGNAD